MNNMNLRRPNDFGRKMNCNFNQNGNSGNNSNCNVKPAPGFNCGFDTSCNMECGSNKPPCGCDHDKPSCGCGHDKPSCGCGNNKPPCHGGSHKPPCGCGNHKPPCGCDHDKPSCGCNPGCDADSSLYNDPLKGMALAIGYVPWQQWCKVYDLCKGLQQGTIFPPLDLPFYGCIPHGYCKRQGGAQ